AKDEPSPDSLVETPKKNSLEPIPQKPISDQAAESQPTIKSATSVSGIQLTSQTWSGNVEITGNVIFPPWATLNILPGTKITFLKKPDMSILDTPWTSAADAYIKDHNDPTGRTGYGDTHFSIIGVIKALGTKESPIIFTSAQDSPEYADWKQITLLGGSKLDFVEVSYAHNGVTINGDNVAITNSKIHDSLWSCVDIFSSGNIIRDNEIYHCWHQAVGVKVSGSNVIENNYVHDANSGVNCENDSNASILANHFAAAPVHQAGCFLAADNQFDNREQDVPGGTYNGALVYPAQRP
ncbi:MAG: right-handed parallel beta-helix repeat-containing protein, partial [Candidatus Paceibacterota bacterium]